MNERQLLRIIQMQEERINALETAFRRLSNRQQNSLARATLAATNDDEGSQKHQVNLMADETKDNIEHFQPFGLSSFAPEGTELAVMFMGGNRDHGISLGTDSKKHRPKGGKSGETVLYNANGDVVHLQNATCLIKHASKVVIEAPEVEVKADKASVNASQLTLGRGSGKPIARVGDSCSCGATITSGSSITKDCG